MQQNKNRVIVSAIAIIAILIVGIWYTTSIPAQTINIQGEATIDVVPDTLTINFNVNTNGETSKEAKDKNAQIVDDAITALVKAGFERKDITTSNFNIYEDYEWTQSSREFKGYKASHTLQVEIPAEKTELISDAIDAGIDAGATLQYINFEISPELLNEYKAQATLLATQNARTKAQAIAEGLEMQLGKVVSISETKMGYYPYQAYEARAEGSATLDSATIETNINPSDQTISANIQVIYRLK